jgi:hypothetical protein
MEWSVKINKYVQWLLLLHGEKKEWNGYIMG